VGLSAARRIEFNKDDETDHVAWFSANSDISSATGRLIAWPLGALRDGGEPQQHGTIGAEERMNQKSATDLP
jgi:hypothetical protein